MRNGTRSKTVLTEASGHVGIEVPRDRTAPSSRKDPYRHRDPSAKPPVSTPVTGGVRTMTASLPPAAMGGIHCSAGFTAGNRAAGRWCVRETRLVRRKMTSDDPNGPSGTPS